MEVLYSEGEVVNIQIYGVRKLDAQDGVAGGEVHLSDGGGAVGRWPSWK
jgi:hypothetical protein